MFTCDWWESFKSSLFYRTPLVPASKCLVLMGKFQEIKRRNSKQSAGRRRPYCQGIFENLLRQENLTVNRFTLVETFFLEVNVEVDNKEFFFLIICKRPFDHRKEFLKNSQFHFKGFHFKSTSRSSFNKVWWKSRNYTEIRNLLEAYLEPSQRSLTEPFCVMAFNR